MFKHKIKPSFWTSFSIGNNSHKPYVTSSITSGTNSLQRGIWARLLVRSRLCFCWVSGTSFWTLIRRLYTLESVWVCAQATHCRRDAFWRVLPDSNRTGCPIPRMQMHKQLYLLKVFLFCRFIRAFTFQGPIGFDGDDGEKGDQGTEVYFQTLNFKLTCCRTKIYF